MDLAKACLHAVEYLFQGSTTIARNVGKGKFNPVPGLIAAIEKVVVRRAAVQCDQPRAGNANALVADFTKSNPLLSRRTHAALGNGDQCV